MSDSDLVLPRRLAIDLLAHAQRLEAGGELCGFLEGTDPGALRFHEGDPAGDSPVWALVRPQAGTPPAAGPTRVPRILTVALDTKGVLQLRCWNTASDPPTEQALRIR